MAIDENFDRPDVATRFSATHQPPPGSSDHSKGRQLQGTTLGVLTEQEAIFVREYLVDRSGARSAIAAGFPSNRAGGIASSLLKRPSVIKALVEARDRLLKETHHTSVKAMQE